MQPGSVGLPLRAFSWVRSGPPERRFTSVPSREGSRDQVGGTLARASSIVVVPSFTFSIESGEGSYAVAHRDAFDLGRLISLLMAAVSSSLLIMSSWMPTRPLYPFPPHRWQPCGLARKIWPLQPRPFRAAPFPVLRIVGLLAVLADAAQERCAQTQTSEAEMLNGSAPISVKRAIVEGASLVWSVETRRWPVSAASMAILGGLLVADLSDENHVGIHAQVAAQGARKTSEPIGRSSASG